MLGVLEPRLADDRPMVKEAALAVLLAAAKTPGSGLEPPPGLEAPAWRKPGM